MKNLQLKNLKKKKGQTALEYALVVAAVSLVVMAAWNTVGKSVQGSIKDKMLPIITDHLEKGNGTIRKGG